MGRPAKYPAQFRRDALELVRSSGRPIAEVARSLGISEGTLWNWVQADRAASARAAGWGVANHLVMTPFSTGLDQSHSPCWDWSGTHCGRSTTPRPFPGGSQRPRDCPGSSPQTIVSPEREIFSTREFASSKRERGPSTTPCISHARLRSRL